MVKRLYSVLRERVIVERHCEHAGGKTIYLCDKPSCSFPPPKLGSLGTYLGQRWSRKEEICTWMVVSGCCHESETGGYLEQREGQEYGLERNEVTTQEEEWGRSSYGWGFPGTGSSSRSCQAPPSHT